MNSLLYLWKCKTKNQIKKAIKKPVTYIIVAVLVFYCVSMINGVSELRESIGKIGVLKVAVIVVTCVMSIILMSSLWAISKRRMLSLKKADVHFLFSAPLSPKRILMYGDKNFITISILSIIAFFIGGYGLDINVITALLCCLTIVLLDGVFIVSLMIIAYGSNDDKHFSLYLRWFVGLLVVFFLALIGYLFFVEKIGFDIFTIISSPVLHAFPLIGWSIATYYSILIEPSTLDMIYVSAYILTVFSLLMYAIKMKSSGEYFEEAALFSEEYEEILKRQSRGEFKFSRKPKNLRKASIEYRGSGAKAILYRQLLEYKKNKFFIFGLKSIINLVIGAGISFVAIKYDIFSFEDIAGLGIYILIGIICYLAYISSFYRTKWAKEITTVYTFLIPDKAFNKVWYSTVIEHVRACIDGILLVISASIGLKLSIFDILVCLGIYIIIEVNKLYISIICDTVIQPSVGKFFGSISKIILQVILYVIGFVMFYVGNQINSEALGFILIILVGIVCAYLLCYIASTQFERMENVD